jgi:23S rRNA pseudouridine1911/1915/1917 synthase
MDGELFPVEWRVEDADPRQRLDTLLVALLARAGACVSRSEVRRWVETGRVLVDGEAPKTGARVRAGARVRVEPAAPSAVAPFADPPVTLSVLFEDDHLVVIDKPAGLVVHPARGHASGTLVDGLLARGTFAGMGEPASRPDAAARPGIVHRLDKDTSGVMVVARTALARERLRVLFSRHAIEREYRAVVVGRGSDATYATLHGRHPTDRKRFTTRTRGAGRTAVTHVRVLERLAGGRAALVACRLETGRTHQIRVHLAECGRTPVLGDRVYGTRVRDPQLGAIGAALGRQWLHAATLGFDHPVSGQPVRFESPVPSELAEALEQLRSLVA